MPATFGETHGSFVRIPCSFLKETVKLGGLGYLKAEGRQGRIVDANPRFCELLGYSLKEILDGKLTCFELTHPDDVEECERQFRRLVDGEVASYAIEKRYLPKDKSILLVNAVTTIFDCDDTDFPARIVMGAVRPLAGIARPPPLQIPGASIWKYNLQTRERNCSDEFKMLLGLPSDWPMPSFEEFISRVHPDDRHRVVQDARRILAGHFLVSEHRIIRPSGEVHWISQSIKPVFGETGEVSRLIGTCLDITETRVDLTIVSATTIVDKVKRYIDEHFAEPLTVGMLAQVANVRTRALFSYCKDGWGFTPLEYIKRVRLNHSRTMLQAADESTTVLGVALKCGFQNHGHFSSDYRKAFGERPSETLKRSLRLRKR